MDSQGSRVTEAAALGSSLPFSSQGDPATRREPWELVTVFRVIELESLRTRASRGSRPFRGYGYVEVELSLHNVGTPTYLGNPGQETSLVSATTGGYVGRRIRASSAAGVCSSDLLRVVTLHSGQTARGCVYFRVPRTERISAVQYRTDGGRDGNIATWALNRSEIHG